MRTSESTPALIITERTRQLVEFAWRFGILSRDQGMALVGIGSVPRMNAICAPLVRAKILDRKQLPIFVGHGSAQSLYFAGRASEAILRVSRRELARRIRQAARWSIREVERIRTENQLLIDFRAALMHTPGFELIDFRTELELRQMLLNREVVPDGWIAWQACKRFNCFVELDFHCEALAVWRAKIRNYVDFAQSGQHQQVFNYRAFRVLVVAKSQARLDNLRQLAAPAGKMFLFAELSAIHAGNFFAPVWQTAQSSNAIALHDA
jgi:hypothetical protein